MDREQARQEIRARWREFGQPDKSGKGIICPLCGNGSGRDGDGITENPRKPGQLKCWKCGFTGDAIDLYRQEYRTDYNEALQAAADYLGITIDPYRASAADDFKNTADDRAQGPQSKAGDTDREKATGGQKGPQGNAGTATGAQIADYTDYYMECMQRLDDPAALSYLQARGISQETAQAHNLGFDPQWISPEAVKRQREKGSDWTPAPTARLIMPVSKNHYVARAISPDTPRKYQKMNETGGGNVEIFNIAAIQGPDTVFIVEGIIDALSIIECGASAIALNSTSNAEQLIKTIARQKTACSFVICPDNDDAGRRAAQTIEKGLQGLNIKHITANISGGYNDPNDALTGNRQELEQAIAEATAKAAAADDYLTAFFDKISGEAYRPYTTGLTFFDNLLSGGPVKQTVLLLLAAPAAGKTTLCQQIAENMARHGKPVLYLNLEMSREQMIAKSISARCTFKGHAMTVLDVLQGYKWTAEQREAVKDALQEYRESIAPYLNYNPDGITGDFETIREYINRVGEAASGRGEPAPVIILDYLHLVSCGGLDVQETIKKTMDMLKQYAIKFNSFAVAISATNRESNKTGRITMESGRDSSGIEYGGDYVLSLNYYQIDRGDVKPSSIEKVAVLQARAWRQMIIRVLKGRLCIPGWSARVYFHAAGNMFYAEDAFLPDDADIITFGQRDEALEDADQTEPISPAPAAGKGKRNITASF